MSRWLSHVAETARDRQNMPIELCGTVSPPWEGEAPAEPDDPADRQAFGSAGASPSRRHEADAE
ncbi:MAG: hypothetical protein EBU88_15855, partial [Acidobacteria bacterium]|nr:hypothetical protein [Acidobacteriota bacterium]